jgi:hypothetical protein
MSDLKVTRLDSPLRRRPEPPPRAEETVARDSEAAPTAPRPAHRRQPAPPVTAANGTRPRPAAAEQAKPAARDHVVRRPDPPPADEMLTLLSARLPESLRARLAAFTAALRTREGSGHVSQKALPEQEVLALAVWALGDPNNPSAIDALARVRSDWHARRHAARARSFEAAARG